MSKADLSSGHGQRRKVLLLSLALVAITLIVYWQVGEHGFVNFDDKDYIQDNPHIASGLILSNMAWAFTSLEVANWHPLTWLSYLVDAQLYGLKPGGYHLTSVVIHTVAAVLLLWLLVRITGALWPSALVAALFALHPMHVESVAWVSERKDVLSATFWFLTLLLYAKYAATGKRSHYLLTLLCFALGLMAKPMGVTLPIVMLLLDVWPLGRAEGLPAFKRWLPLVKEKLPFFALALLSAAITIHAQQQGGAMTWWVPFGLRLENAVIVYATYIARMFWPHDMVFFYHMPYSFPVWRVAGAVALLALVTAWVIWVRRCYPFLLVGWFWFLITLLPVIGLVRVGDQSMADRYTYIPYTGLFIMVAWGVPLLTRKLPYRQMLHGVLAGVALTGCIAVTWQQIGYWRDDFSLFGHALQVTPDEIVAHYNLAAAYEKQGDLDAAIGEYRTAIAIKPDYYHIDNSVAHNNIGLVFEKKGDIDAAIGEYRKALAINPNYYDAHNDLAIAFGDKGDLDAAIAEFQSAIAMAPTVAEAHNNLGLAFGMKGALDEAIKEFRLALDLKPEYPDTHHNLGYALKEQGDLDGAIKEFREAVRLNPESAEAQRELSAALSQRGPSRSLP